MSSFDQRGQRVVNQTNVGRDQNIAGRDVVVGNKNDAIIQELQVLLGQVQAAAQSGELDADTAVDVEYSLKKATVEAAKEQPDKSKFLEYLDKAKTVFDKVLGVSKSGAELAAAFGAAYAKINGWL